MIRSIQFSNLKAFQGSHDIPLAPLTFIYGRNSAGKSSLLQSLLLLKQTIESTDPERPALVIRGPLADLGSVPGIIYGHNTDLELKLGLEIDSGRNFGRASMRTSKTNLSFKWDQEARSVRQTGIDVHVDGEEVASYTRRRGPKRGRGSRASAETPFRIGRKKAKETFFDWILPRITDRPRWRIKGSEEALALLEDLDSLRDRLVSRANLASGSWGILPLTPQFKLGRDMGERDSALKGIVDECEMFWWDVSTGLRLDISTTLESLIYLGPLRRAPERFHILSGARRRSVGREGEYTAEVLNQNPGLATRVNKWLGRLEVPYTLTAIGLEESEVASTIGDVVVLALTDNRSGLQVSPGDVGFGISQLLPIVVQALGGQESTICVEQPEIHVHPYLQGHIADLLIEASTGETNNQLVVETHSEHLMLRVQTRIREGKLNADDIKVLYVDTDDDGSARVLDLLLDQSGEFLDEWPEGFFEERFREMFGR